MTILGDLIWLPGGKNLGTAQITHCLDTKATSSGIQSNLNHVSYTAGVLWHYGQRNLEKVLPPV